VPRPLMLRPCAGQRQVRRRPSRKDKYAVASATMIEPASHSTQAQVTDSTVDRSTTAEYRYGPGGSLTVALIRGCLIRRRLGDGGWYGPPDNRGEPLGEETRLTVRRALGRLAKPDSQEMPRGD
jgi:hypothetical protein